MADQEENKCSHPSGAIMKLGWCGLCGAVFTEGLKSVASRQGASQKSKSAAVPESDGPMSESTDTPVPVEPRHREAVNWLRVPLWQAIHKYVEARGGYGASTYGNVAAQHAVIDVEEQLANAWAKGELEGLRLALHAAESAADGLFGGKAVIRELRKLIDKHGGSHHGAEKTDQ